MNAQSSLFDVAAKAWEARTYANRSSTSRAAANSTKPRRQQDQVLDFIICAENGATREEISKALGIKESAVCGRVASLVTQSKEDLFGLLPVHIIERGTRVTTSGKAAAVLYALAPSGNDGAAASSDPRSMQGRAHG